jgi:hypothetical protein
MKDDAIFLLNSVTLSVMSYRMVVELSHYLHHGTGYSLNSLTLSVVCSRIFAELCYTTGHLLQKAHAYITMSSI